MNYIAHIRERDKQIQTVEEHLLGVKCIAEQFGKKMGVKHIAGLAGMLHDMGKYTIEFREYIWAAVHDPGSSPKRGSVDHSTAGGKLLFELFHQGTPSRYEWMIAEVVGNAIISHHSYLHDFLNAELRSPYLERTSQKHLKEFEQAKQCFFEHVLNEEAFRHYVAEACRELEAFLLKPSAINVEGKLMYLTKFIFSALIDADRTNTRLFEEDKTMEEESDRKVLFQSYYAKLMGKIDSFPDQTEEFAKARINRLRREMSDRCGQFAERPSGIYTLSIPTGGGKTLASLRYALKHAVEHGKKHVIFIVPYTTIIEQNAQEIRKILKDDPNILEHHTNVIQDANDDDEHEDGMTTMQQKLKLAKDNWDAPVVLTTLVQFLNVFYAKGSRNIRRLHNLCQSVIVFDEVQKVPVSCISLFNQSLNFLKSYGSSSLILCTATQPALDFVQHRLDKHIDAEIIPDLERVVDAFKRVEVVDRATNETFGTDKLADFIVEKINEVQSVLVILNTKTVVKKLYHQLSQSIGSEIPIYHLSTSMCAAHRKDILDQVRGGLNKEKMICISTQLIEAGVDISFDCVIRSLAGLDSIAQAAGRCNRHGGSEIRHVYVIDHEEESLDHLAEIKAGKGVAKAILVDLNQDRRHHGGSVLSVQAMERYFKAFYSKFESSLNYFIPKLRKDMMELLTADRESNPYNQEYVLENRKSLPLFILNSYRSAAEHFRVIEDRTTSVIVPYGDKGRDVIARLNGGESIDELTRSLREAQQYTIQLFPHEEDKLSKNGGLVSLMDGKVLVVKENAYNDEYGLDLDNDSGYRLSMF
ncbi:CRISPR-associated helicase Cas3' [Paenibacillus lycopersici]|uniref:CRISPR-associated helicase Cas3 n=1 Tax=Paenibacillus lycopersici TaxID=2704462 RepID=A0A6C0G5Y2_9BACL|nr:CRISPR-associated helicase Cas3' [Paenibacillus lycopersici]QHT63229.1 CRISPR-associated helicase Cas3' [Paenibacillus lycopersici]